MSSADLQAMHRTIDQLVRDTGRRPGEIVSVKFGCVEAIDGQHDLICEDDTAARLRQRLPITAVEQSQPGARRAVAVIERRINAPPGHRRGGRCRIA